MKLSVIVPTYHRNHALSQCLDRLAPGVQSLSPELFEVIVTDDGKRETAEDLVGEVYKWARWVKGPQKGPAANRNAGARHASGQWLIFTDDDCLPDKDWLTEYYKAIEENPQVQIFEGRSTAGSPKRAFSQCAPINERGGFLPSCNFGIHREVFRKMKGFDEEYPFSFEDMDFHHRLKKDGHDILFLKEALILHPWRNTTGKASVTFFANQEKGILTFIRKHPEVLETFNSKHFLAVFIKKLFRNFIPGLVQYKGRGISHGWRELGFNLKICFTLLPITISRRWQKRNLSSLNPARVLEESK